LELLYGGGIHGHVAAITGRGPGDSGAHRCQHGGTLLEATEVAHNLNAEVRLGGGEPQQKPRNGHEYTREHRRGSYHNVDNYDTTLRELIDTFTEPSFVVFKKYY
jgi:hypothetical protein